MRAGSAFLGFVIAAGIGGLVGYAIRDSEDTSRTRPSRAAKAVDAPGQEATDVFKVPVGDSYAKGPADALVTIVEFSDFQCPFCARVLPTLTKIRDTYGPDVRVVFKHNPLPFHRDAPLASEYVLAAGEQGKFWEMHDAVFANQKQLKEPDLKQAAKKVGLDLGEVEAYVKSGRGKAAIAADQKLARQIGAGGTPAFFINGVKLSGAQPFAAFKRVIDAELAKAESMVKKGVARKNVYAKTIANGRTTPAPAPQRQQQKRPPDTRQRVELADGVPAKGGKNPLVTIVEFSDFECPFCSRVNPTLDQVMKTYGDDVQIRFRNLPLSFHKRALPAAKAAVAAGEQGKFWEMHDKLFANQKALSDEDFETYAKDIGLDLKKFKADLASKKVADQVAADQRAASKYGARGTPTLFVNGMPLRGAQPFPRFKDAIDKEIALAKKLIKEGVKRSDVYGEVLKREAGKPTAQAAPGAPAAPSKPVDIELGRAPIDGKKDAPIQVVMYSDFECPFCGRVNPSIEQVKEKYGDKVVVAFKHYPLPFHKNAKPAAIASLAAHRQGKFWPMHEKLFANQRSLTEDNFVGFAKELGLDVKKFKRDLADPALAQWVDQDMAEGAKVGVRGTPATFINGRLVSGAQPFPAFERIIDEELNKS
jgi:protein-disulfide isomerase